MPTLPDVTSEVPFVKVAVPPITAAPEEDTAPATVNGWVAVLVPIPTYQQH